MYASAPWSGHGGHVALFVGAFCIILSMYGGGFATVPAYLADMFGTQMVGAIHGRLLTAWSAAGIFGPVIVNYLRKAIGQERGGHISPLAAYDAKADRFLILDVARYKYPPVWVKTSEIFDAMNTTDSDNDNKTRGYVLVSGAAL